ncbi:MAG: TetR/AcrR family transcriptional regulator [Pseudomonadota bacterium]
MTASVSNGLAATPAPDGQDLVPEEGKVKRIVNKEHHRLVLLEATASVMVEHGISGTTISKIQEASGVSRGMINLHFQSKDNLILAVAKHVEEEYRRCRRQAMEAAGSEPLKTLKAIIQSELSDTVLNLRLTAVWMALRSESNSRPELLRFVDTRDRAFYCSVFRCLRKYNKLHGVDIDCRKLTLAIMSIAEGLLTDYHLHPDAFDRDDALDMCWYAISRMVAAGNDNSGVEED